MSKCIKCGRKPEVPGPCPDCGHVMGEPVGPHRIVYYTDLGKIYVDGKEVNLDPPPLNKQLLTDLEAWRAYLRILLDRLTPGGTSLERDALKAWSIADDALALSLNKAIGEK